MQVRKCTVAGIAAVADELPLFYPIAYGHQGAIFLQVPVHGLAAIVVRDDDVIAFRQVRIAQSALVAVFFYRGNNTAAGSAYPASLFHFKIKADLSLVTEAAVVGLDKQVLTAFRERKCVDITTICFYPAGFEIVNFSVAELGIRRDEDQQQNNGGYELHGFCFLKIKSIQHKKPRHRRGEKIFYGVYGSNYSASATTSFTSGIIRFIIPSIPALRVIMLEGQPLQLPCIIRFTLPSS